LGVAAGGEEKQCGCGADETFHKRVTVC
jgi:hypothetical protein